MLQQRVDELPVLATTAARLMMLDRSSETLFDQLVELVEREPSFAARLVALANSAAYRRSGAAVTRIRDAALRVGSGAATHLVVSLAVVRVFVPSNDWERALWVHALMVAALARALAAAAHDPQEIPPDDAYLCGLLHDLGRFVLFNEAPEALRQVEEAEWSSPADLVAAESAICGFDHAEIGAMAAERWGLPATVVAVVRRHHQAVGSHDPLSRMISVVQAADRLDFFDVSPTHGASLPMDPAHLVPLLRSVLPRWYPVRAESLVEPILRAVGEARDGMGTILPARP